MSCHVETARPPGDLYRVARTPDPWEWPDWAYSGPDGTFGNRYDDPRGEYRVLYASSQRLGALLETLARFRPDPAIVSAEILGDPRDAQFPTAPPGTVPARWLEARRLGTARCDAAYADVGHTKSLAYLREVLAPLVIRYGVVELDAAAIRLHAPRRVTQEISRHVYECMTESGERAFQGIRYLSRLGDDVENWAICEPSTIDRIEVTGIRVDDPDLIQAVELLRLEIVSD